MWTSSLLKLIAVWGKQDQKASAEWNELYELLRNSLSEQRKFGCRKKDVTAHCCVSGIPAGCKARNCLENPDYRKGLLGRDRRTVAKLAKIFANYVGLNLSIFFLILDKMLC